MLQKLGFGVLAVLSIAIAGCTVHQTDTPGVTGPSTFATALNVVAVPNSINEDGGSESTITVSAFDQNGQPLQFLPFRLDMKVHGVFQDFGTIATRNLSTDSTGRAQTVFTAPQPPSGGIASATTVTIVATPIPPTGLPTLSTASADIRLTPPGVIVPPLNSPNTPTAVFAVTPVAPLTGTQVQFDGSASCGGQMIAGACDPTAPPIISYAWSFGDGGTGSGRVTAHSYGSAGSYSARLTVTNSLGVSGFSNALVTVATSQPVVTLVFSPLLPAAGQLVQFSNTSVPVSGRSNVSFDWNFGDGSAHGTGASVSHAFASAGTYAVVLTVTDDLGQQGVASGQVVVH